MRPGVCSSADDMLMAEESMPIGELGAGGASSRPVSEPCCRWKRHLGLREQASGRVKQNSKCMGRASGMPQDAGYPTGCSTSASLRGQVLAAEIDQDSQGVAGISSRHSTRLEAEGIAPICPPTVRISRSLAGWTCLRAPTARHR